MKTKEQKIGIGIVIGLAMIFFTSLWKSIVEAVGWAGKFTENGWAPYMHHSRWGALMMVAAAYIFYFREKKWHKWAWVLLILGAAWLVHHLATEQCFAIFNPAGDYAGGLCK